MSKQAHRQAARARLSQLSMQERREADAAICTRIWTVGEVEAAGVLLVFASLPDEVATDEIVAEARRRGIAVAYPRCIADARMTLHSVAGVEGLRRGRYGILEPDPDHCAEIALADVDAALVPGLAWDRRGRRLGRGAGFYDRLFADPAWSGFRCGVFYAAQEATELTADPWDVALEAVVTERDLLRFGSGDLPTP